MIDVIRKYNFWDNAELNLGFARLYYTDRLLSAIGNNLIKVVVGQRRAGKSYVLRQTAQRIIQSGVPAENILYVNKEFIEYNAIRTADDLQQLYLQYREELKPEGKVFLFIDEIQQITGWERFVGSHSQDFAEPCELFVSGSNSDMLSGELSTLLSGRYIEFEVLPFSFAEYSSFKHLEQNREAYNIFLSSGMLPELLSLSSDEMCRNYVSAVKDTVMLRDIVRRYNVKDVVLLDDIFSYVVCNAGRLFSVNNLCNYFRSMNRKVSYETVAAYLDYLQSAFLIHKAERWNISGKEILSGNVKYYTNDLAYYNYLFGGYAYGRGSLLENAVFLELQRLGYKTYVGVKDKKEVDFVAMTMSKPIYIQVCYQVLGDANTMERELSALQNIDEGRRMLVTLDDVRPHLPLGIQHLYPWELNKM